MKKVLFTVALMFGAMVASAQVSVVKEAKGMMKKDPAAAAQAIEAALTNPETANDPNTWQVAGDIQKVIYDAEYEPYYLAKQGLPAKKNADKPTMYNSLMKMFEYYLKCDELEQAKVASGELKKAKLRKKNANTLLAHRNILFEGGADAYEQTDYPAAIKFFGMFADVAFSPIFEEKGAELQADESTSLAATYAAMGAYFSEPRNVEAILKYGPIGKNHKAEGYRALQFMVDVYGDKENGDINKKIETLKEGIEKYPEQEYFVQETANAYLENGKLDEGLEIINNVINIVEKPYYIYLKGVFEYEKKDYNSANATFDKLIALGGDFTAEAYAMKGNIYFYPAQKIVEENSTLALEDPKYNTNEAKIKEAYELSQPFYEKARELEPDNTTIWGQQLLRVYYKLNNPKYQDLEKELGY